MKGTRNVSIIEADRKAEDGKRGKPAVGVRELKAKLSHYLRRVKSGERLEVAERGKIVAVLMPAGAAPELERIMELVREGRARWNGGKPAGSARPIKTRGRTVSEIVIEERR
ncbi:MAG: type II toxin-antitoxin system prevent-host-death family antitoxin [Candidatus Aminicenantes bacterium]|nr:type II toxin-antitoxin system prevent-host-death family antitoxin [Candidatus Aminicenantes bacterium]